MDKDPLAASLLFLWLHLSGVSSMSNVEQKPWSLQVQEGESTNFTCSFPTSSFYNLNWYRWKPSKSPKFLFGMSLNGDEKQEGRVRATLNTKEGHSYLYIKGSQLEDSATYLCARNYGNDKLTFGTGTRLTVTPNITDPQPAVYQLRSSDSKSSNLSMCLLTDFVSQTNVSQRTESETVFTSHTVLNMKSLDSKSYGALAWSQNSSLSCQDAFSNYTFVSSSDASCDAKLVEKSFETDMNLNFQNLSVIGLRLLLLKVAGFNLLMTLRLWSS